MTYVALKLSGYPSHRVIGSRTVLDTARLKDLLSRHLHVDSRSIHAFIIGKHGDSAYETIEIKGATYYGVVMAVCRIAEPVIRNKDSIMPVSVYLDGLYGLHDICSMLSINSHEYQLAKNIACRISRWPILCSIWEARWRPIRT